MFVQSVSSRGGLLRLFNRRSSLAEKVGLATLFAAFLLVSAQSVFAHEFKVGSIEIGHPWTRATPPGAAVGGGYLTISNEGSTDDRLISATADVTGRVEIHEMAVKDGIMTMRALPDGLLIPAGQTVKLDPGGFHIMFLDLKKPFVKGQSFSGTLTFEKAGTVKVSYAIEAIGATAGEEPGAGDHDHDAMPGMDMSK
ncbi:copper chaperone PCu(A)C [Kaistia dalseonensis]|uniref:Copper(I)-binding protein n=1 Tax=Kaistia dalseonensis TaxID=410840 RepID=A0ABU0HAI3_9HYPH|nr:copper chaperone PCu(A)C [Kaistia dalseonensis]MCX5496265.1 copper chaperone PCu(A)C [Kaistia dalseonensis]MDQ0438883.1 copper(I)-binding protein [Kaistia dalseonensis]